ncbi:plexin domain-containing protein 2 [Microplitis mediator]|uniref:plexin domain-containing protein 2 n=1 Tax=Microplitis mediator TaxID=375433 RepID=UPI0025578C93|nr:plexin domain-containing protein 2 [Microplitis mediator]XP_057330756.1 plexin domain-containing protein 2 [Microplitis mediator]XP_057330757.1 plexin domain-containing protein 2 [Microplitis mediator]XP_057330758.1 plexin domain-containing protein 2 [Microplitis mediator]
MACERYCLLTCGYFIGFTVALVLGSLQVIAEPELSYYNYKTLSELNTDEILIHTPELDKASNFKRLRRSLSGPEPSSLTASATVPLSSRRSQDPIQESPLIKTNTGPTANVTYSTENITNSTDESTVISTTLKPNITKNGKNSSIIVSQPIVPVTGPSPTNIHVWANQTRWPNATQDNVNSKMDNKFNRVDLMNTTEASSNSSDLDDISISKFTNVSNNTLTQNNTMKQEDDTHQYYNSTFIIDESIAKNYWVDMDNHPNRKVNDLLSQSHRRAATVELNFDFPFYGHKVRNITIATGGFLYTGDYVHSWLAATQYIAPLMANFDTRLSNDSYVKYADNGTAFTVEWTKVVLQDKPKDGEFTFQVTLYENGNIVFVYKEMPLSVEEIEDKAHPVKVGLSDAYIMDRTRFFVRKKTIYEYHRVHFNHQNITNWTVIFLRALPTCLQMENCTDCLTKVPEFTCKWCAELNQCSTGTFRQRQDWLEKGCDQKSITEESSCPVSPKTLTGHNDHHDNAHIISDGELSADVQPNRLANEPAITEHSHSHVNMSHMSFSGIISILLVISLVSGLAGWAVYAYRNPHSASGQMLIRYRPSQWSWRRGEARYTAATIHM